VKGEPVDEVRSVHLSESVTCLSELVKCCPSAWTGALILKNSAFPTKMLLCSGDVSLVDLLMKTTTAAASASDPPQRHPSSSSPPTSSEGSAAVPLLRITQRLRLDPTKLDDVTRRISAAGSPGHCMLLATRAGAGAHISASSKILGEDGNEVVQRPLKNLVHYLKQKQAAGVIPLTSSSTHPSSTTTSASPAGTSVTVKADVRGSLYAFPPCPFANDLIHKIAPNFVDSENSKEEYLLIVVIRGSK
jgi:RNA-binding protein 15